MLEVRTEDETDSVDVVEAHDERDEAHHFNERKKDVAERTAQQVGLGERVVGGVRRGDNENEARAKQLAEEYPKSSEKRKQWNSWLERRAFSVLVVESRSHSNEEREYQDDSEILIEG